VIDEVADGDEKPVSTGALLESSTCHDTVLAAAPSLQVGVVMLGDSDKDDEVLSALRAGATGFLPRDTEPGALVHSLRAVAAGDAASGFEAIRPRALNVSRSTSAVPGR